MKDDHPWLEYLSTLHAQAIVLSLERVQSIGNQHKLFDFNCPVVLIAGTNGKGSTLHALEQLLIKAGCRVASYTSPHIVHFNERIKINGSMIDDAALLEAFAAVERMRGQISLTYFEFTTLAAFYIFQNRAIDVVLAEIGLGGRLDAVNTLHPQLSIITSIGLDHQVWLGNTLEEIAIEKAGILRQGKPCILGQSAQLPVLLAHADQLSCQVHRSGVDHGWRLTQGETVFNAKFWYFQDKEYAIPAHQLPPESVSSALAAYLHLQAEMELPPLESVVACLQGLSLFGRFNILQLEPTIIIDVAHNQDSCALLKQKLACYPTTGQRHAFWAMLNDKEIFDVCASMRDVFDSWVVPQLDCSRATPVNELIDCLSKAGINKIFGAASTKLAYRKLLEIVKGHDQVIVFGSFYTVSAFLNAYQQPIVAQEHQSKEYYAKD